MLLRSWLPRRPSEKLRQRLFSQPAATRRVVPDDASDVAPFRLGWLVPATIALVLTCVLFNQRNGPLNYVGSRNQPIVATILSKQSAPVYFQRAPNQHNHLLSSTF